MLRRYSLLCISLFTYCTFVSSEKCIHNITANHLVPPQEQNSQRELAMILKRLKSNAQQTLNELHDHMHYNSEHQHNNPLLTRDRYNQFIEAIIRYGLSHKDITWLKTKQDRDQRVIINLEALQPILADPSAYQELVHIINDMQKDQQTVASTLDNHTKWNEFLFYGLPISIFFTMYRNSPKNDRLANAIVSSVICGPIVYYIFKHKDIDWLHSDMQERSLTIGDLQTLAATLSNANSQSFNHNDNYHGTNKEQAYVQ